MVAYYNEIDPRAAEWLRILILQGDIAPGIVDERSIEDVRPEELMQYTQCHFFAGIGGWSYALRLAGWSDDRPCWTGSPPCQPFSNAGKQKAQADARHLWPVFFNLISECQPPVIFGEQVEAAIRTGWLDDLQDDLEAENYACGKIVLPACSVGAPHIRQRIWVVAERLGDSEVASGRELRNGEECDPPTPTGRSNAIGGLADTNCEQNDTADPRGLHTEPCGESRDGRLADPASDRCAGEGQRWPTEEGREPQPGIDRQLSAGLERSGDNGGMAESDNDRRGEGQRNDQTTGYGHTVAAEGCDDRPQSTDAPDGFWSAADWLWCRDGKWRPVEPGTFPLANGVSGRVGLLRGYGNAIVSQVAAEVIKAYMDG